MRDEWSSFVQPADQVKVDWVAPAREPGGLREADVREIRRALGKPYYAAPIEIASHYGISLSMVSQIRLRRVWAHVDPPKVEAAYRGAAEYRLGSFDGRRGQKARTAAALRAWEALRT